MAAEKFRILDLGAHDGYVTTWLARKLREDGIEVELYGVEPNEQCAGHMLRRMREHNIDGDVYVGLAEDFSARARYEIGFDPDHAFDAVVAFELIEHVVDPNAFLKVCEDFCKPRGRVYISTPDGTFGEGQNPHHLHAFRVIDLFDIVRRRGYVEDMEVGADGVSTVCYEPHQFASRGEIAIYTGPCWSTWSPIDIETKGLGGSETAATRLAEALSRKGFTVTVYGDVHEGAYGQVAFRRWETFDPTVAREAVISSRMPGLFAEPVNAQRRIVWVHDVDCGDTLNETTDANTTDYMVLSDWHLEHFTERYPFISPFKITQTENGIEPSYFNAKRSDEQPRHAHRAIYSSSPDRGLDLLLEAWSTVRGAIPDAELVYCYSDVYNAVADKMPAIRAFRDRITELADQPGVFNIGSLPQNILAVAMREAALWLAPSWSSPTNGPFFETYCIGAVEAAAAGCHLVIAPWGALPERLNTALYWSKFPPLGDEAPHPADLAQTIIEAFEASDERGENDCSIQAIEQTWDIVANDFSRVISGYVDEPVG